VKEKLIYGGIFLLAFLITTGAVYYLNNNYKNIFQLDFTPLTGLETDSVKTVNVTDVEKQQKIPDQITNDSLKLREVQFSDSTVQDTVKPLKALVENETPKVDNLEDNITVDNKQVDNNPIELEKNKILDALKIDTPLPSDTNYTNWMKKTAGLFESMDAKKAAKIIERYSDNIARDIIYRMKKKKAAEILAELSPDTASRITRMQ
jgi:flagellar motility protein MotE (MotC chaperone)